MKYYSALNPNSLPVVVTGNPASKPRTYYYIIEPDQSCDEVPYTSWYDAVEAVIDSSPAVYKAVEQGLRDAQIIRRYHMHEDDYQHERSEWLQANAKSILADHNYRIDDRTEEMKS
jgi:hypothetical protein